MSRREARRAWLLLRCDDVVERRTVLQEKNESILDDSVAGADGGAVMGRSPGCTDGLAEK